MTFAPIDRARPAVEFWVHVQPRAQRAEVAGSRSDALLVRVTAPPRDGEANEAVRRLLAETLHLPSGVSASSPGQHSDASAFASTA